MVFFITSWVEIELFFSLHVARLLLRSCSYFLFSVFRLLVPMICINSEQSFRYVLIL